MDSPHTPGPWQVRESIEGTRIAVEDANGVWVADARPWTMGVRGRAEQEANAQLISAAPDMAEALAKLVEDNSVDDDAVLAPFNASKGSRFVHLTVTLEEFDAARAALAKAGVR